MKPSNALRGPKFNAGSVRLNHKNHSAGTGANQGYCDVPTTPTATIKNHIAEIKMKSKNVPSKTVKYNTCRVRNVRKDRRGKRRVGGNTTKESNGELSSGWESDDDSGMRSSKSESNSAANSSNSVKMTGRKKPSDMVREKVHVSHKDSAYDRKYNHPKVPIIIRTEENPITCRSVKNFQTRHSSSVSSSKKGKFSSFTYLAQFTGNIVTLKDNFGYIRVNGVLPKQYNQNKDVFFRLNVVTPKEFKISNGDEVRFSLGTKNPARPMALKVVLVNCERDVLELEKYMDDISEKLDIVTSGVTRDDDNELQNTNEFFLSLLSSLHTWECLANCRQMTDKYILRFLSILCRLEEHDHYFHENIKKVFVMLSRTQFLSPSNGQLKEFIDRCCIAENVENVLQVQPFILLLLKYIPEQIRAVSILIKPMVSINTDISQFLYTILRLSIKEIEMNTEDLAWQELPHVPSSNELLFYESSVNDSLQPVKINAGYSSPEEYMDIYFRLFRADFTNSLRKGITNLLNGTLDPRDMHVYRQLCLAGIHVARKESDITLALHVKPSVNVKDWDCCSNLRFGNLLCISVAGTFKDVIWASVVNRQLLKKYNIVLVALCSESNSIPDSEAFIMLQQTTSASIMVESPTYYMAYQPVLNALQKINPTRVPFKEELVFLETPKRPFADDVTIDADIFNKDTCLKMLGRMELGEFVISDERKTNSILDESQDEAMVKAIQNRVAIIQGPPGTGKTFIGFKLIQLLLSASPSIKLPILVLTYKNHVLDEFLKELHRCYPSLGAIVRIGGRSEEPELEACNINMLKRKFERPFCYKDEIDSASYDIEKLQREILSEFAYLVEAQTFHNQFFYRLVTGRQILQLLLGCDWTKTNVKSLHPCKKDKDGFQTHHKGRRKGIITKGEVKEIVDRLATLADKHKSAEALIAENCFLLPLVEFALSQWMPNKQAFDQVDTQLESIFGQDGAKPNVSEKVRELMDGEDEEYEEEAEIERLLVGRKGKIGRLSEKELLNQIKFVKNDQQEKATYVPQLSTQAKKFGSSVAVGVLLNTRDLWSLSKTERVKFIQMIILRQYDEQAKQFQILLDQYKLACAVKKELDDLHKCDILLRSKVVGMTITGASMYHELLKKIRPAVIIVEEAAEVLEAQLLAAIGDWGQYLVLIGDHKQLRPQVESFDLVRKCHMDISMMERLVRGGLPYTTLRFQSRMRPEVSELLLDIYPTLKDNTSVVMKNVAANCIGFSVFFWDHDHKEKEERSYTNEEEAVMVLKLALFLMQLGYRPEQITILAAYKGQTALIRKKCQQKKSRFPRLYTKSEDSEDSADSSTDWIQPSKSKAKEKCRLAIHTIDMYQGDENDFVIVSLVRSNSKQRIGFLNTLNRRCVAQSRSRCGLYFIGSRSTLCSNSNWARLIDKLDIQGKVAEEIPLNCPNHREETIIHAKGAADVDLNAFCRKPCPYERKCGHECPEICQPSHSHKKCLVKVDCMFADCGHPGQRFCYQDDSDVSCQVKCSERMNCEEHACSKLCGKHYCDKYPFNFNHSHDQCKVSIKFVFQDCLHTGQRKCFEREEDMTCLTRVEATLTCGHRMEKTCSQPDAEIVCKEPCPRKLQGCGHPCENFCGKECKPEDCKKSCTIRYKECDHPCQKLCRPLHGHDRCEFQIQFKFTKCGHIGKKQCYEEEKDIICNEVVMVKFASCDHVGKKQCFERDEDFVCQKRCTRRLADCGHPCGQKCGEACRQEDCKMCAKLKKAEQRRMEEELIKIAKDAIREQIKEITKNGPNKDKVVREELLPSDETAAEYYEVEDRVRKYVQPGHNWYPVVKKIEKVTNYGLEIKWLNAKKELVDPRRSELKFHGTNETAIIKITESGFLLPKRKDQMYGQGIYFATDSSKSAQKMYTKGSKMLLLCDVLLGKSFTVDSAKKNMTLKELRRMGYDSLYAKRNTRATTGVLYDEFVVYNPDQALPKYIIHYEETAFDSVSSGIPKSTDTFTKHHLLPKREVDPNDFLDYHYRMAESQFLRLMNRTRGNMKIISIDYYHNPDLISKFDATEKEMAAKYGKKKQARPVFAFHGTKPDNVEQIMKENFRLDKIKRAAYGNGIYFSEFPDISIGYGTGLLLCKVLPGKSYRCDQSFSGSLMDGFDSHIVRPRSEEQDRGEMIVINNPDQILPCYVINFSH